MDRNAQEGCYLLCSWKNSTASSVEIAMSLCGWHVVSECVHICVCLCMQGMVIENMLSALYLNSDGTQKHMKGKSEIHSERKWMNIRCMAQRIAFVIQERRNKDGCKSTHEEEILIQVWEGIIGRASHAIR